MKIQMKIENTGIKFEGIGAVLATKIINGKELREKCFRKSSLDNTKVFSTSPYPKNEPFIFCSSSTLAFVYQERSGLLYVFYEHEEFSGIHKLIKFFRGVNESKNRN